MDKFEIEIMPDGEIKIVSPGSFKGAAHKAADELLLQATELMGTKPRTKSNKPVLGAKTGQTQHKHSH